ncbi:hypothetical protein NRIC_03830 [Enterococcus florum]|uniref:Uncharacterized protein n=1 Tax=Enterococcus florum TaxID=2480627 RepID=A0A4P5PAG6_9ENTE|nr:hypothetical protein [Enterococcus florum]GCF92492.1 hypothetical protein NRIC_03830 [Enterococcus florum]
MSEMDILRQKAEKLMKVAEVKPVAEVNGQEVFSYEDAAKLNRALLEERIQEVEVGERETVNGGLGYTSSRRRNVAINPASYFDNRFRTIEMTEKEEVEGAKGKKAATAGVKYEIVLDTRAIQEQASGRVYAHNIPTYIIEPTKKGLKVESSIVSDTEFINEFKHRMSDKDMMNVRKAIDSVSVEVAQPTVLGL